MWRRCRSVPAVASTSPSVPARCSWRWPQGLNAIVVSLFVSRPSFETILRNHPASTARVTGLYAEASPDAQLELIATIYQRRVTAGVLLTEATAPLEATLRRAARRVDLELAVRRLPPGANVLRELAQLSGATAILALPDPAVFNPDSVTALLESCYRRGQPVVGFSPALVTAGSLASAYASATDVVAQVEQMLPGLEAGRLPDPQYPAYWKVAVNESVARSLDLVVSVQARGLGAAEPRKPTMSKPSLRGLSITAQLILLAVVPTLAMCAVLSCWLYSSRVSEIRNDVGDHGRMLVTALAQTSRYAVVAGNTEGLKSTLQDLIAAEPSLVSVEVLDEAKNPVASASVDPSSAGPSGRRFMPSDLADTLAFQHPIRLQPVLTLEGLEAPEPAPESGADPAARASTQAAAGRIVGYVNLRMSVAPLVAAKMHELLLAGLFTLAAAVFGGLVGLAMAQRLRQPLSAVMGAIRDIRRGRFQAAMPCTAAGELGELQRAIVDMAASLGVAHHNLEAKVAARTAELHKAMTTLAAANEDRRRLIAGANTLIEEERRRIAVEFHDHLGSALVAARMKADHIAHLGAKHAAADGAGSAVVQAAGELSATLSKLYGEAREIIKQLRPEVLDTLGLARALGELLRQYEGSRPACRFVIRTSPGFPALRGAFAITAYRVVQEAVTNIAKHANARLAELSLLWDESARRITVIVSDDGRGFDLAVRTPDSLGLVGMRERVEALGGRLTLLSGEGGTTVTFTVAVDEETLRMAGSDAEVESAFEDLTAATSAAT